MDQVRGEGGLGRSLVEASRVDTAAARDHDSAQFDRRRQLPRLHGPTCRRRHHHQTSRRYRKLPSFLLFLKSTDRGRRCEVMVRSHRGQTTGGGASTYLVFFATRRICNAYA